MVEFLFWFLKTSDNVNKNKSERNANNFIQKEISDEGIFILRRQFNPLKK